LLAISLLFSFFKKCDAKKKAPLSGGAYLHSRQQITSVTKPPAGLVYNENKNTKNKDRSLWDKNLS
jgi:hypothetical protein